MRTSLAEAGDLLLELFVFLIDAHGGNEAL